MVVLAMGFVCMPMFRASVAYTNELESEQTLYEARLAEIEKDVELGRLDTVSAEAARAEEARRLIKASEMGGSAGLSKSNRYLVIAAALFLPLMSIPVYLNIGSLEAAQLPSVASTQEDERLSLQELIAVAEKRLEEFPDDVRGWEVLGPVYLRQQRFGDAEKAFQNIIRIEGRNPQTLLSLANVYIEQTRGQIDDRAKSLVLEILEIDSENPNAKYYLGIAELQSGNEEETRRIWQAMIDGAQGNEEWYPVIQSRLAELDALNNQAQAPVRDTPSQGSMPQLDNDTLEAANRSTPQERAAMINQMVSGLDARLRENPDDKQGWERLVNAYMVLGKHDEAIAAVDRANQTFNNEPEFMASLRRLTQEKPTKENEDQGGETQ